MSIAGSDPGGGAGIQADLKTFSALGVHGTTVITSIAVENTIEVRKVHPMPLGVIEDQFRIVMDDFDIRAVKCGMLFDREIAFLVADLLSDERVPLILDPVMVAEVGDPLAKRSLLIGLRKLAPMAKLITPNRDEAEKLIGRRISDVRGALEDLSRLGSEYVLLKGGHFAEPRDKVVDFLYECGSGKTTILQGSRIAKGTHGSGCTISAAIAAFLARSLSLDESVRRAKSFISDAISNSYKPGKGAGVVNQLRLGERG